MLSSSCAVASSLSFAHDAISPAPTRLWGGFEVTSPVGVVTRPRTAGATGSGSSWHDVSARASTAVIAAMRFNGRIERRRKGKPCRDFPRPRQLSRQPQDGNATGVAGLALAPTCCIDRGDTTTLPARLSRLLDSTTEAIRPVFELFRRHGLPERIRTDKWR